MDPWLDDDLNPKIIERWKKPVYIRCRPAENGKLADS
jgi:hypothetical protein